MTRKINLETGEKSGLEKNGLINVYKTAGRGNNGIHLKAYKKTVKVICEALVTIFESLREYGKATEGWRSIMPHLPL